MANKSLEELLASIKKYPKPEVTEPDELRALIELVKPEIDAITAHLVAFENPASMVEAIALVKKELSAPESPFSEGSDTYGFSVVMDFNMTMVRSLHDQPGSNPKQVDLLVDALADEGATTRNAPRRRRRP